MSALWISVLCLLLFVVGREVQHYDHHVRGRLLTPSRCEHFLPDEDDELDDDVGMDTFAAIWNAAYAEDPLERWWAMEAKEHA